MAHPVTTQFVPDKTLLAWAERAYRQGLLPTDLQSGIDDPEVLLRSIRYLKLRSPHLAFASGPVIDVRWMNGLLNLGYNETQLGQFGPPPQDLFRGITFWHPGLSLCGQRDHLVIRERKIMIVQDWYQGYQWATEEFTPGYRRVCLPAPDTANLTLSKQEQEVAPFGEKAAHIGIASMGWLAVALATGERLLKKHWARCKNQTSSGNRAGLLCDSVALYVGSYWDDAYPDIALASARD